MNEEPTDPLAQLIRDLFTEPADPYEPMIGPSRSVWERVDAEYNAHPARQMWLQMWSYGRRFPN